eukprot:TRINITY_DN6577_c0_g1_i2.p3 TRINITY_DN6577_c0_g1~~TRINITY_DN6577_c0_g1_i2.p3  ORF type:complete len:120 (-),score=8.12 TRINITY_DN6577_c0_g1_i2:122-481(-)
MRRVMEQEETCGRWCSLHMLITGYVHYGLPGDTTGWFLIGTMRIMVPQAMRKIRNCDHKPSMLAPSFGMGSGSTIWPPVRSAVSNPTCPVLTCLLYTSDAADEEDSVDLGGRRIIKKKK